MTRPGSPAPTGAVGSTSIQIDLRLAGEAIPTPLEALERLRDLPHRALLESRGEGGRFSFLSASPRRILAVDHHDRDPFEALERLLGGAAAPPPSKEAFPFPGGVVGYLGYEAGWALERLPEPPADDVGLPETWFAVYDWALIWDRKEGGCRLQGTVLPGGDSEDLRSRMGGVAERLREPRGDPVGVAVEAPAELPGRTPCRSSLDREAYVAAVDRIREYIRAGDVFQANLTRRITVESPLPSETLYRRLTGESPAPFAAFLETGDGEVVSVSPESFLSVRDGRVETRPIKGTAARGASPEADLCLREGLRASEKDRAENVMIVDLLRSDLSRVCEDGSVEVPDLLALESHPTVHHLVSTVRGRLRPGLGPVDLLRATFPGGSVTGAPKIRAMEILNELEPVRRGVYTGALGVLGFGGAVELSIPIRTAVCRKGRIHYGTGGGITLASEPEAEWRETEDKARAFLRALGEG